MRAGNTTLARVSYARGGCAVAYGVYAATKAAVETVTVILSKELRRPSITVNAIVPGPEAWREINGQLEDSDEPSNRLVGES